jgi:hypothetical protein
MGAGDGHSERRTEFELERLAAGRHEADGDIGAK